MAPASNEEQFKFLISCIRYSNNGKVDFGQVAKECKIVSKGAAAKRYERMMRSHGIAPNAASIKPGSASSSRIKTDIDGQTTSSPPAPKRRKADPSLEAADGGDDDEAFDHNIKPEEAERLAVKSESESKYDICGVQKVEGAMSLDIAANLMQYYDSQLEVPDTIYGMSEDTGRQMDQLGGSATIDEKTQSLDDYNSCNAYGGIQEFSSPGTGYSAGKAMNPYIAQAGGSNHAYDFGAGDGSSYPKSFTGRTMKSENDHGQNFRYRPLGPYAGPYAGDNQGGSDSPVIVE